MAVDLHLIFGSRHGLQIAVVLVGLTGIIAAVRRVNLHALIWVGAMLLTIAAGQPIAKWNKTGSVVVMVDLSPSTRGAMFRDRRALEMRIDQVLAKRPYQAVAFSDHNQSLPPGDNFADLPANQTLFTPPMADAILLFSDGQFDLPASSPPVYAVLDPVLDHPLDDAVTQLKSVGRRVAATVQNDNPARQLIWTGATTDDLNTATPTGAGQVVATLPPGDRWPENDSLALNLPPPALGQSWWIGPSPPAGWRGLSQLPTDSSEFLNPAIIVLNNIPADSLSSLQQQNLLQYVRDLGGALVIVGGDHAFAAGNYDGSLLEDLSPLSSSSPLPTQRWLLLIDGSGSMAGEPWHKEIAAVSALLPQLPPHDQITVGSFARSLSLWPTTTLPSGISPTGPTNLAAALQQIIQTSDGSYPTQLLLMTDADAELPNPKNLADAMNAKKIHLHLLAIGHGKAFDALSAMTSLTGGSLHEQLDPQQWVNSAKLMLRSALPDRYQHSTVQITPGPPTSVSEWNQTWLKPVAIPLQTSPVAAMSARWQLGLGKVIAVAYPAQTSIVQSFANQITAPPRDPRFKVTWDENALLVVTVNAVDGDHYLNGRSITMAIAGIVRPIPQTGPGEYQISLPSPQSSQIATVKDGQTILERFAIAGRYPAEFEAIGNDRKKLKELAGRTGGKIIPPGPVQPIDFQFPAREIELTSILAFAGFAFISLGLIRDKTKR